MATPRLPFLYPNLMRAVRACEPSTYRSLRLTYPNSSNRRFHTSRRRDREAYQRRYGPAVEPSVSSSRSQKSTSDKVPEEVPAEEGEASSPAEQGEDSPAESHSDQPQENAENTADTPKHESSTPALDAQDISDARKDDPPTDREAHEEFGKDAESNEPEETPTSSTNTSEAPPAEDKPEPSTYHNQTPFDDVLHMPSPSVYLTPSEQSSSSDDRPHLSPAPYVHHFDTYSLVQDLTKGGFSPQHSITIMKAVRAILQNNLDLAKESLTSKSDVENEEYLFKAACSELQSSLQTARNSEIQLQRSSRTQLQHETDIISQRVGQEISGVKDDIKGMFNDHKMVTREQQRSIDTSVQELNYKITVSLNSDGKSEIESLRWILTRRAAMTIAICAFMIIVFLKYASTRKVPESKSTKEEEKPIVKEITTKTQVIHDADLQTMDSSGGAHLGESLG
ncbi:Protein of unknown function DUF1640 [Penicillium brevicompactum]|uniref:MOZ protein represents a chromatin-associated acetyltransferase n=1 Tax=Penicillium brevicompactum TaxID=5074 RepID=A0A9W9QIW7_PENBR|nr:Protein of unknown function DUF1640 [Penicillium brevicompactum]